MGNVTPDDATKLKENVPAKQSKSKKDSFPTLKRPKTMKAGALRKFDLAEISSCSDEQSVSTDREKSPVR